MEATQGEEPVKVNPTPDEKPLLSRLLPWVVLLLAALALLYFLNRGCAGAKSKSPETTEVSGQSVDDNTKSAVPVKSAGQEIKMTTKSIELPSGTKINAAEGSAIATLSEAFASDAVNSSTPSILDNGDFQGRSAVLTTQSEKELELLASILKAYPNFKIRIEAHCDNTGNADVNQQLTTQQALAVRSFLQDRGIVANRLSSVGRGQTKPLVPNDTDEGKAKNRRIEIYVISVN